MKKILLLTLAIVMSASLAFAQGGNVGLYSDSPGYSDCNLNETLGAINAVYVVHDMAPTGNTAQFKIVNTWGALQSTITWNGLSLGDPFTGIVVSYVGCKPLPYLVGTMNFIPLSPTPPCTATLQVVADPSVVSGSVETVDCNIVVHVATGGTLTINGNSTDCPCMIVGTETSNWSKVKALYQ
jgi:hypothetical protein